MTGGDQMIITAPRVCLNVSATIGRFTEMTGLQYMMMRMIDFVKESGRDMTLHTVLDEFGIPDDLIGMFIDVLRDLNQRSMIKMSEYVSGYTSLADIEFTNNGRSLYREGFLVEDGESVNESIYFCPANYAKYRISEKLEFVASDRQYDYALPSDVSIANQLQVRLKKVSGKRVHFRGLLSAVSGIDHYVVDLLPKLVSDDTIDILNGSDVDETFIRANYSDEELFEALGNYFILKNHPLIHNGECGDGPEGGYHLMFPSELEYRENQLTLFNENRVTQAVDKTNIRSEDLPFDMDIMVMSKKDVAVGFWFVRKSVRISGFGGSREVVLLASKIMDSDLIPVLTTDFEYSHLPDGNPPSKKDQEVEDFVDDGLGVPISIPSELNETRLSADRGNEEDQFRMAKYLISVGKDAETYRGFYYLAWSAFHKQDLFDYFVDLITVDTYPLISKAVCELEDKGYIIKNDARAEELFNEAKKYRNKKQYDEAKFAELRSALMGNAKAYNGMALIIAETHDHPDSTIVNLVKVSAQMGYPSAMSNLGAYYEEGLYGLEVDLDLAEQYYEEAADAGHTDAREFLCDLRRKRNA